jgi:hypothetical protein
MDTYSLVAEQLEAGKQLLAALRREGVPVELVFWHRPDETSRWMFCVATPLVEQDGPLAAARKVVPVRRSFGDDFPISGLDMRIIKGNHPVVRDLLNSFLARRGAWAESPLLVTGANIASEQPQWYHVTRSAPVAAVAG